MARKKYNNRKNITLDINPEIICEIIDKARAFQAKEGVSFPEEIPGMPSDDYDWLQTLAAHKDDLTYIEVRNTINQLEADQQIQLVALLYIGRGDYDVKEWRDAVKEASAGWTRHTAEYLLSKPQVADYLEEGLALLGYFCHE